MLLKLSSWRKIFGIVFLSVLALGAKPKFNSEYFNPFFTWQNKWEYQNPLAGDVSEKHEFFIRALDLGSQGKIDANVQYMLEFHYDNWEDYWGFEQLHLAYTGSENFAVYAGYLKKHQLALNTSGPVMNMLMEKESLWSSVMEDAVGMLGSDLGLLLHLDLNKVKMELAAFNAYPRSSGYNPVSEDDFWNNPIKNWLLSFRFQAKEYLTLYSALQLSGKPENNKIMLIHYDPIFLAGAYVRKKFYEADIEGSIGYNHFTQPHLIPKASKAFVAWKLAQRAMYPITKNWTLGALLNWEGVDPAVSNQLQYTNDAGFRYYYGLYLSNQWMALSLGHNMLQNLNAAINKKWRHNMEGRFVIYY